MADVTVVCQSCGKENTVSEYASPDGLLCTSCHHPLTLPERGKKSADLRIRKIDLKEPDTLSGETTDRAAEEQIRLESAIQTAAVIGDVHKARQRARTPHAIWGYLTFLLVGGALVGLQYMMKTRPDLLPNYELARNILGGIGSLLLLIVAFLDSTFQGLLCLLLWPYALYYAVVRLEVYWIRGIFLGVVVAIASELYFMPDKAVLTTAQKNMNVFIDNVGKLIGRASEAPVIPGARPGWRH